MRVVDHGDGLHHHAVGEVGEAEVDQDQVEGFGEEGLLLSDGGDDHQVADNADHGERHVHHHSGSPCQQYGVTTTLYYNQPW